MPLSGAAMISENTAAAASSRFAGSLSAASTGVNATVVATVAAIINFTLLPSLLHDHRSAASFDGCFLSQVTRHGHRSERTCYVTIFRPFAGFLHRVCEEPQNSCEFHLERARF